MLKLPWYIYSVIASLGAVFVEFLYRTKTFNSFLQSLPAIIPIAIVIQFGLYHSFRDASSFLLSWAVFSLFNAIIRVIANHYLGEYFGWKTFLGIILMLLGVLLIKAK
jgi:drug/metabolite transporter (DMT)-like permease